MGNSDQELDMSTHLAIHTLRRLGENVVPTRTSVIVNGYEQSPIEVIEYANELALIDRGKPGGGE